MPTHDDGASSSGYANTNGTFRKEIKNHVASEVTALATVMRVANNVISESDNFHFDCNLLNGRYKFEVQYKKGQGALSQKTVAVVLVETNANSVIDFKTCLASALNDGHIWRVS